MTDTAAQPRWATYMPVADLAPALRNAKAHDLHALAASFDQFGAMEPVVLDERTGRLVSGHGRVEHLAAQQQLGAEPPEGVEVDGEGRWCWLVTRGWRSRDDDHAHAAGIALNRVGERGGWVPELAQQLDDLARVDRALLDATGFSQADLDLLVAEAFPSGPTSPEDEWRGMPGFDQADRKSKFSTTVHFLSAEDAERFWREVFKEPGPQRSVWWPRHDGHVGSDQKVAFVADSA